MVDILASNPVRAASIDGLVEQVTCIGVKCDVPLDIMVRIMNTVLVI